MKLIVDLIIAYCNNYKFIDEYINEKKIFDSLNEVTKACTAKDINEFKNEFKNKTQTYIPYICGQILDLIKKKITGEKLNIDA